MSIRLHQHGQPGLLPHEGAGLVMLAGIFDKQQARRPPQRSSPTTLQRASPQSIPRVDGNRDTQAARRQSSSWLNDIQPHRKVSRSGASQTGNSQPPTPVTEQGMNQPRVGPVSFPWNAGVFTSTRDDLPSSTPQCPPPPPRLTPVKATRRQVPQHGQSGLLPREGARLVMPAGNGAFFFSGLVGLDSFPAMEPGRPCLRVMELLGTWPAWSTLTSTVPEHGVYVMFWCGGPDRLGRLMREWLGMAVTDPDHRTEHGVYVMCRCGGPGRSRRKTGVDVMAMAGLVCYDDHG
ncbi:hypothetical protein BU16DRAFT_614608 [Lophium mytilinum]|uniref:Uncharacterized protein n=1 Tax=Lophium mytilinum TaxID=390894 RepID=A0A6A6R413_9PEZI|nr:hypothetical protein BU16DRAFT_614608 [Lophium mytilinum]